MALLAEVELINFNPCKYEVFKLPRDYALQLRENGYLCMEYVGHLNWVIPKDEQTEDQYYFIKGIFEPR